MKRAIIALLLLLIDGSTLYAVQPTPYFSGQDYLNLSYQQRSEVIYSFIEYGKDRGITISNDPIFYCRKLDAFYAKLISQKKPYLQP